MDNSVINPSLVRDKLIFYLDVENNKSLLTDPVNSPIEVDNSNLSLTAYKDLINGITLYSETPTLCASHPNKYLKFNKDLIAIEQGSSIKNYFNQTEYTILLWVKNRDDNQTYNETLPIFGQTALFDEIAKSIFLQNSDKEIKGINGIYNLQTSTPRPNYINADNVQVYWNDTNLSWNIGITNDPTRAFYTSFENVNFPWQVNSWTPQISSVKVTTNMPTLSFLNQNNIFRFTRFDTNNNKEYRTNSIENDKITKVDGLWNINFKNNFYSTPFYVGNAAASEPYTSSFSARVSSISAFSDAGNNLAVNYFTLDKDGEFRVNSHGIKQIYYSENRFYDNRESTTASNRRIIHITNPRSLVLSNVSIFPTLNQRYTQSTANPPQFTFVDGRFIKNSLQPWTIQRRASSESSWITWYTGSTITDWPWQVVTWVPKITGFNIIADGFSEINDIYYTDGEVTGGTSGGYNSQTGLWNYISKDNNKRVRYRELVSESTSFSFDINYPPINSRVFDRTGVSSNGVSVYELNTSLTTKYRIVRDSGKWSIRSNSISYGEIKLYESENADFEEYPYNVTSWVSTVTALSTKGGGLKDFSEVTFDFDAEDFFTRANIDSEEEKPYIDAFVRGCKDLGLWDVMVCWPMLSSQNAANTLNVYSLGGSGEYNGLMEGSNSEPAPTIQWTANGLRSPSVHNRISTTKQRFDYNQRTFYATARSEVASYGSRARFIHSGWSEPTFLEYGPTTIRGMALNDSIAGHAQGGASIGNATYHIEGTDSARFSAFGINAAPPFNTLNTFATHTATLCSRTLKVFRNGVVLNTGVAGINNQPPPGTNLGNPNPGGTWADSLSDGAYLHFMNSMEKGSPGGSFAGLIGTMAFAADFDIALSEQKLKAFDDLYRLTLGRSLPLSKPTLFNNDYLLNLNAPLFNGKTWWVADKSSRQNIDSLELRYDGDPLTWYYVLTGENNTEFLAFSASNPSAEYPWNVEEWIPLENYTIYQAPSAIPIVLQPPTNSINRFTGLSGWVIESTATGNPLFASAANPEKVEAPWTPNIPAWVKIAGGTSHNVTSDGLIVETLQTTQDPELSAWYIQFGQSDINAYRAESIETFPWNVPYALWEPVHPFYTGIPAPVLIRPPELPINVEPVGDAVYVNVNFSITPFEGGTILKNKNGKLGFKLENSEPKFSTNLGPLVSGSKEWHLVGLSVSGTSAKLYKDLNVQPYSISNSTFGLTSISIGSSNIDIGQVLVYNKQLTDTEINKTYRWFKGRYHKNIQSVGPITEPLDPDAQVYIEKNNITVLSAQKAINDFCSEIKDNDLWGNIVCWPLRSSQMIPTGNTVYSLGGLGDYEGNIFNGSLRQDTGLFLTSNQYISTNSPGITGGNPRSLFVVTNNINGVGFYCGEGSGSNTDRHQAFTLKRRIDNIIFIDFWYSTSFSLPTNKALGGTYFNGVYRVWTPSNFVTGVNDNYRETLPGNFYINSAHKDFINVPNPERQTNNYAFVLKANKDFTKNEFDIIYNIYKRTLGQGLILT